MSSNQSIVPNAKHSSNQFKGQAMAKNGYNVNQEQPDLVKYEVAQEQNIPLKNGDNGDLTAKEAGKIGGKIGGNMVKELVRKAERNMKQP